MTNKIIEAARAAGFRTGAITLTDTTIEPIPFIAPVSATDCKNELARFYAIARAEALEDAAKVCDALKEKALASQDRKHLDDLTNTQIRMVAHLGHGNCAEAIRALKEQQHG